MLNGLRCSDDGGIEHLLVCNFSSDVVGFRDQPVDRGALHTLGLLAEQFENLAEARTVINFRREHNRDVEPAFYCEHMALQLEILKEVSLNVMSAGDNA
jgi:hypothetical protein